MTPEQWVLLTDVQQNTTSVITNCRSCTISRTTAWASCSRPSQTSTSSTWNSTAIIRGWNVCVCSTRSLRSLTRSPTHFVNHLNCTCYITYQRLLRNTDNTWSPVPCSCWMANGLKPSTRSRPLAVPTWPPLGSCQRRASG